MCMSSLLRDLTASVTEFKHHHRDPAGRATWVPSGWPACLLPSLFLLCKYFSVEDVTTQKVARNNELKRSVKTRFEIAIALHR